MSRPLVPATPPDLLPDRAAVDWLWLATKWLILSGMFGIGGMLDLVLLPEHPGDTIGLGLAVAAVISACLGLPAALRCMDAARAEHAAGYTTVNGMEYRYWQLEPKTGKVLRRPGERVVHDEGLPREVLAAEAAARAGSGAETDPDPAKE